MPERETKYCSNCGEEIDAEAEFCLECGVKVESRSSLSEHIEVGRPASSAGAAALVGGIISVIGVFLPWLSFLGTTVTGLDFSGGVLVLVLSLLVMGLVYFTRYIYSRFITSPCFLILMMVIFGEPSAARRWWRGKFDASTDWYRRRPSITCALPLENSFIPIKKKLPEEARKQMDRATAGYI